jgi:hypothetical protein
MHHSDSVTIEPLKTLESIPSSKKNISDGVSKTNANGKTFLKDSSKPDGDACRDDGTLKDASELDWPNSPSDIKAPSNTFDHYAMDQDFESLNRLNEEVRHIL